MLLKESLYGWGVCDIPMPRAAYDIFNDRRRNNIRNIFPDRRKAAANLGTFWNISKIFIDDVPYRQLLLLSIFFLSCLVFIYVGSKIIPEQTDRQMSRFVDITVQVM